MKRNVFLNIAFSLIYEFTYALSGLIVPKLLLSTFGSEANGLVSSLTSFLGFFIVVEGGMRAVLSSKLYKPLIENDKENFNKVVNAGAKFYRKIGVAFAFFSIFIGVIYPLIRNSSFSFPYVFFLVIIISANSFVFYYSYLILSTIVYADNKSYITYGTYTLAAIINILFVYFGINYFPNLHFIKLLSFLSFLINPLILKIYVKRNYSFSKQDVIEKDILNQRWDGFAHNLSMFIMNNVDVYVLTFFSSLISVSIYSVYSLIIVSIKKIVDTVSNVLTPLVGRARAAKTNISEAFNIQLFITGTLTVIIFSCTYVLINPFIKIYTSNIIDANYINPEFAFLFVTSEMISSLTSPYINITYAVGDFKNTKYIAYIEVVVNVVLSVCFVFSFGLVGVIIATLIARIIRIILQLLYIKNNEKEISVSNSIFKSASKVLMVFVTTFILSSIIEFNNYSFVTWLYNGLLSIIISIILCFLFSLVFDYKLVAFVIKNILQKLHK